MAFRKANNGCHFIESRRDLVYHRASRDEYIKGNITKHILPKFFFTHDLQKSGDIIVQQIRSSDKLADLFTKALPTATFKKLVHSIGMRRSRNLSDLVIRGRIYMLHSFPSKVFNEATRLSV
nr:retrotransposon like protein [Tanacetum cinerariifolium]